MVRLEDKSDVEIEFVIDTGFEGFLTLPPDLVAKLSLPYIAKIQANIADNSKTTTNAHAIKILWNGTEREVIVLAMGRRPLLGTALLADYHLSIDFYEGGIQATDITTPFIETGNLFYVDEADWIRYPQGRIKKGELLIEVKGKAEKISIVPDDFPEKVLVTGSLYKLTVNNDINRYYLLIYLITKYGIAFRNRYKSNLLISFISKQELYSIPIPSFSTRFQVVIESIFIELSRLRNLSNEIYQQAENLLLSELGLKDWQPTEETVAVKSFAESFLSCDRLDAEYYQPKYDQVEEVIKGCGFPSQNLGSLINPIQNGFDYREYTEEGTPYIRVGDVKNGQINFESAVKIPITMADVNKPVGLQVGDILFTRKGSFGNSAVVTELEVNGIISSEIMLVRLTSAFKKEILPEYVSLFLNSKFGYLQVERRVHGVAYYSISQPDLANLLIPILPKPQQQKIVEKIKSSFLLKLKSKQLLEIAKTGVERAIETDEATATAWINQQLEALGINLSNSN
ncbi:clan AA aspartic protease [Nostoc sp. CALU 546]|uniref:clan AA aspartic protease n=1 Tax=Nostoc sp. CALU 546 TaxID=1867241 RepID=UPI003B674142